MTPFDSIPKNNGYGRSGNGYQNQFSGFAPHGNNPLVKQTNLQDYGYDKAEIHRGNAKALGNLFNQISRGYLIDEGADEERRQKQKQATDQQILELEKKAEKARTDINTINSTNIPKLEQEIEQLEEQIYQIRKDEANGLRQPDHLDRFRLWFFWGLFGLLTVFVFLFYVSSFYSAFYRDLAAEMQSAGQQGATYVLAAIFARKAFTTLDFHWVGPFLLFAFGGFLHILSERKSLVGKVMLAGMVLIVLATDMLLAYFIEDKNFELKVMMGLADKANHQWWLSPVFYLVIAMGFIACLVWSGFLHTIMLEVGKKDVGRIVSLEIKHRKQKQWTCKSQIKDFKAKLISLEGLITQINLDVKSLKEKREKLVVSESELEKYITDFYDGWLSYVNNRLRNETLRNECEVVLQQFYQKHLPSIQNTQDGSII